MYSYHIITPRLFCQSKKARSSAVCFVIFVVEPIGSCLEATPHNPALRLKHRSGSCGTASALPKCSIMSGCGTRIVLRGQKPLALCDRCPCFGSPFPPLAALTFAASSIICAFGLASAAPRSPYRHLELCGIALTIPKLWHICHNEICRKVCLRCRGRCSPYCGARYITHFYCTVGPPSVGGGCPALP